MTDIDIKSWVIELEKQITRERKIFVHLGIAYPLAREAINGLAHYIYPANEYLGLDRRDRGLLLIPDLECLIGESGPELGRLRERVYVDLENGSQIIMLSRSPRAAFPNVPGSSLIHETKLVVPPDHGDAGFGIEAVKGGTLDCLVLRDTLFELREACCASLDAALFEEKSLSAFEVLDREEQEPFLSSGLAVRTPSSVTWAHKVDPDGLRDALSFVLAEMRSPQPELSSVAVKSWEIERQIKQALRARAGSLWTSRWKTELFDREEIREAALRRARAGTCAEASSIGELRDPLEWLTVAEVLRVREHPEIGNLGLADLLWRKFEHEFLPVKDRIERSQLLRKKDLDITRKWASKLSSCLSSSGSRDPEEIIGKSPYPHVTVLRKLHSDLKNNPLFCGDAEKDFMSLVAATVRFLINTFDTGPDYTKAFSRRKEAPLEGAVQHSFRSFLDASGLAGLVTNEVGTVAAGRADVVLHMNNGKRYITEVKRELDNAEKSAIEKKYLEQTVAYQGTNMPFGHLLVLDLTPATEAHRERIENSIWVTHKYDEFNNIISSVLVSVVRGNRKVPSARKNKE